MFLGELESMEESSGGGELGGIEGDDGSELFASFHGPIVHNLSTFTQQILVEEECLTLYGNLSMVPMNVTCLGHAPTLNQSRMTRAIILIAMAVFSLMGNVATMLSIRKSKRHKSIHVYTLIYHLSIADLWVTFWCILGEALWFLTVEWKAGNWGCKIFKFSQMFGLYLSTFIMVLIGVDRFIAVKYPLKSMRKGLCNRLVGVCWGISAVLSLPQIFVFHVDVGPFVEEFYQCVTYGTYTAEWQEHLYATFTILFMFIIPLIILASTYLLTVCTLQRKSFLPRITHTTTTNK
ncbi:unnamed protein product [Orchesella dallaii]|uniref:G-protein coupled receptors family 1 profile domain-containing protein n=1 Tax=Orchesella dallaii TaxID=48710 RepID=A0ABP1QT95_9HEXA